MTDRLTAAAITDAQLDDLYVRLEQTADLLRIAEETSNQAERERARAVQRAERAEAAIDGVRALATRLEEFAENALKEDDRTLYAALASDLRTRTDGAASGPGATEATRPTEPTPAGDCEHCPDGHTPADSGSQTWGVHVADERDGDGQPTHLIVARSGGAHVAESDAEWIRQRLNPAENPREPQPRPYTGRLGRGA